MSESNMDHLISGAVMIGMMLAVGYMFVGVARSQAPQGQLQPAGAQTAKDNPYEKYKVLAIVLTAIAGIILAIAKLIEAIHK